MIHLHVHTEYSFLDGLLRIDDLVADAEDAIAITDHGNTFGHIPFYKACRTAGVKPLLGIETYLIDSFDDKKQKPHHLILIARNNDGYRNLLKLSSIGATVGPYRSVNKIDRDALEQHCDNLICLSACIRGELGNNLLGLDGYSDDPLSIIRYYMDLFGENFFLEVQPNSLPEQKQLNNFIKSYDNIVVTNDVHYRTQDIADAQKLMFCVKYHKPFDNSSKSGFFSTNEFYLMSEAEVRERLYNIHGFSNNEVDRCIANTYTIADMCAPVDMEFNRALLPSISDDAYAELCDHCFTELAIRELYGVEYDSRLQHELGVINRLGISDYFLICKDVVDWCRNNNILTGPGRGSSGGSLVCYLCGITGIDPIKHNLLFERFLHEARVSPADIDIDFQASRRFDVINYLRNKYGYVYGISTISRINPKSAIKDIGWILEVPFAELNEFTKTIDDAASIDDIQFPDNFSEVMHYAKMIAGLPRQPGQHAAGVVVCEKPVYDVTFVAHKAGKDGMEIVQCDMDIVEELGLLKIDILGLKTLDVLYTVADGRPIDWEAYTEDDDVINGFREYGPLGIFQIEKPATSMTLKKIDPASFKELCDVNALARTGAASHLDDYVYCKANNVFHTVEPRYDKILADTYGNLIYQEQIITTVQELALFTAAEADYVRKVVGKKIKDESVHRDLKKKFIVGCGKNGIDSDIAQKIWDDIIAHSGYGFNLSHAVCYSAIACAEMYYKIHRPIEFLVALLNLNKCEDDISLYVGEARRRGIDVLPPAINVANINFERYNDNIICGLSAIKGLGEQFTNEIIIIRGHGLFESFYDFIKRTFKVNGYNKKNISNMICAGCFREWGSNTYLQKSLDVFTRSLQKQVPGQRELFDAIVPIVDDVESETMHERLIQEHDVLKFYLTGHPANNVNRDIFISEICESNKFFKIGCVIDSVDIVRDKNGKLMAFVGLSDETGSTRGVIFSNVYETIDYPLLPNMIVEASCKYSDRGGVIINSISKAYSNHYLHISTNSNFDELRSIFNSYSGNTRVIINTRDGEYLLPSEYSVTPCKLLYTLLDGLGIKHELRVSQ